jgi:hypothetical protein
VEDRPHAEPEQRLAVEARLRGQRARVLGDAVAVAARVPVGRLDRRAPPAHDVEEARLEAPEAAVDVGGRPLGADLPEDPVRAVQVAQRLLALPLQPGQLRLLARDLGGEEQVAPPLGHRPRQREALRGAPEVALLARDHPAVLVDLREGALVLRELREHGGGVAARRGPREVAARDPERRAVHLDHRARRRVAAAGLAARRRLRVGARRRVPVAPLGEHEPDVVERLRRVERQLERAEVLEARAVVALGRRPVAADHRHHAEVLLDERPQPHLAGRHRALERAAEQRLRVVERAAVEVRDRHHVVRVRRAGEVVARLRHRERGHEAVGRRLAVGVRLVEPRDPAQQRPGERRLRRRRQPPQELFVPRARRLALAALLGRARLREERRQRGRKLRLGLVHARAAGGRGVRRVGPPTGLGNGRAGGGGETSGRVGVGAAGAGVGTPTVRRGRARDGHGRGVGHLPVLRQPR